jgi:hypothetical protein
MNQISLLTKGRTIRGLKERPGHYKLVGKSVLPNFSGPKSPAPTTIHQEGLFQKDEGRRIKDEKETPAPIGPVTAPALAPEAVTVQVKEQPSKPRQWRRWAGVAVGWVRSWVPVRPARPLQSATVQTELVLDRVKVLRNDLIEDDLEVVMLDSKTGERGKPAQSEKVEREKVTAIHERCQASLTNQ